MRKVGVKAQDRGYNNKWEGVVGTPTAEGLMGPRTVEVSKTLCLIAAAIVPHSLVWANVAEAARQVTWATGAQFQQRLAQPVDILWSNNPLRAAVAGLSAAQQVAILIDRRVDPGQKLQLTARGVPMETALQMIAERCGLGVSRLGAVVYLGPPPAAQRLHPIAAAFEQAVRQLSTPARRTFLHSKSLNWEDLASPRELLAQLGQQNGIEIAGLERVPHDLWAAVDLPSLSLIDRLTLIAAQFDLTFKVAADGARLELVPVPDSLSMPAANREAGSAASPPPKPSLAQPAASVERIRIQRLSVQAGPLGPVLRQLAQRLGLELRIDEKALQQAGISLDQRITVKIENATVDELLRQLLKPAGLMFRRHQKVVEVLPAK
jgi:hypothetical protein